jgi:hypothetical protein
MIGAHRDGDLNTSLQNTKGTKSNSYHAATRLIGITFLILKKLISRVVQ